MAKTTTNLNAQDRVRLDAENDIFVHRPKRGAIAQRKRVASPTK